MCKIIESSLGSAQSQSLRSDSQAAYKMENPADVPRVKFLCSFGGTILPRPMDGKLRYVGGDTRIVSVARIVGFTELMTKMKELFESASLLKYQQPDEDLDALVSVVNDEDVVNMMEEYDKLGQNDGLTRLRIFLFSHTDDADSSIFDMDGRESQRRYVDALNSLNDPSDFSRPAEMGDQTESFPLAEQFFHSVHLDRMRNYEVMASQYNGHQFSVLPPPLIGHYNGPVVFQDHEMGFPGVPHIAATLAMVSGREVPSQAHTPRYNEMEVPWSPAFHSSSGHLPSHESRLVSDFSSSPSGPRGRMGFDIHDTTFEECSSNGLHMAGAYAATGDQAVYDHLSVPVDNPLLMQQSNPVLGDSNKFQLNANTRKTPCDGSSKCEHCHLSFPRNQTVVESHCTDGRWRHTAAYLDHAHEVNKVCCHCKECFFWKEGDPLNLKDNAAFLREKQESEHNLADLYGHERGPIQPMNHWAEETRSHISGSRRINERYTHLPYGNSCESHPLPLIQMNQEDLHISHHVHAVSEFKGEDIHENIRGTAHKRAPLLDDLVTKYENFSDPIGKDDCFCPPEPAYSLQKTGQTVGRGTSPSELSGLPTHTNGAMTTGFLRATPVGSPRLLGNNENPTVVQDANLYTANPFGASVTDHALSIKRNIVNDCNHTLLHLVGDRELSTGVPREAETDAGTNFANGLKPSNLTQNGSISNLLHRLSTQPQQDLLCFPENIDSRQIPLSSSLRKSDASASLASSNCQTMPWSNLNITKEQSLLKQDTTSKDSHRSHKVSAQTDPPKCNCDSPDCYVEEVVLKSVSAMGDVIKNESNDVLHVSNKVELSAECLKLIPELMASVKKAKLEGIQQIQVQENGDANHVDGQENDHAGVPSNIHGSERSFIHEIEPDEELNNDNPTSPKIEETKAEEEALEKGLQTIKNCDLEEVRELGSGTYGSVYHGKWRGSDVAIKRIKPSCFAGKPSERERLIGDFWKEALILSSLHHPNVVSFYGVVRDGPGGSLATVTEFMVNGSLKQVLQRKDRTIDRRKRLIIAMDASFGMEYLHEKKIVHFDLKCENLLVNMKDPHRPVCKIGDLGLSKVRQHTLVSGGVRGTLPWMAPELLSGKSNMVTEKIDVYSFGIVMWEVLTGGEPYADMHSAAIIGGIVNNSLRPQIPPWCDPEWKSLMESCWSSDPGHRPSFAEISQALRKMFAALNVK